MAWRRDQSSSFISGSTIYAYTEVDWNVEAGRCTYTHLGGVTSPYYWDTSATGTLFWREWSGGAWGAWHEYASGTAHFGGYGDKELVRTDDFFARQAADREVQLACDVSAAGGTGSAWLTYTVPHLPNAPASITATRVSDNQVTVSWTAPTLSYDAMCLEVSIDGGSWSEFTQLWNASTSTTYSQASADHSYRFRARAYYQSAYSDYTSPTAAVAMTPSAPQSISVAASGGTNVAVTLINNSPVATSLEYQTSTDGGSTWSASTTVSGSPVTSFSTSVSGTALIRVRNKNATGVSGWLVSDPITTICPPAPPTLRTPSGNVVDMASGSVTFSWLHNSLDGSTQTAYQLRYAINGGAWTTLSGTTSQSLTVSIGTFSVGNAVTWQVRTKGADASYSDWSQTRTFNVYTAPTVSITSPGATITGMPISMSATYSDMTGFTCQAATVSLQNDGRTLFSEPATISGSSITASLDVSEFLPANRDSYTVVLTARSSSGLSTSANATFLVDFVEPQAGALSIVNDPDTGYASLLATFDNSASEITYTGSTNVQYESTEGYMRSLTVNGKSEVQSGSLVSIGQIVVTDGIVPYPYRQVEYIESSGGAYIDTGFVPDNDSGFMLDFALAEWKNDNYFFGAVTNGTNKRWGMIGTGTYFYCGFGNYPGSTANRYTYTVYTERVAAYVNYKNSRKFTVDGTDYWTVGTFDNQGGFSAYAFGAINITGTASTYKQRNYRVTITQGTAIVHDFVPVERMTDNVLGAYDLVTGNFLTNAGSGSYTKGDYVTSNYTTITTPLRGLPQGKGDELQVNGTSASKLDRTYYDTISAVGTVSTSGSTWYAGITTTNQATLRRNWTSADDFDADRGTTGTEFAYCTKTTKISATGKGIFVARTWNGLFAYCTAADAQELGITTSDFTALVGAGVIARNKTATDALPDIGTIEIGSAFTVATDLDTTFAMTTWDGSADAVSISVSRVNADETLTPLITDGASGSGVVDKYAPLNTPYQYAVTTKASSQTVKTVYVDNIIETDYWFAYWGENVASAKWNPDNGGIQVTRPQKTRVYYAGRRDPVSYDGHAVALTESPSWMFIDQDEVKPFVQLIEDGGRGVYKSCDGWVYHADFDLTLTPKYTAIGYYGGFGLSVTRIAGEKL